MTDRTSSSARYLSLSQACLINPKKSELRSPSKDLPVSFVPMAAVDEQFGCIVDTETRPFGEVEKGFSYFREGDVLLAKITPCMENGKAAIARGLVNGIGFGSTEFHVLRPREGILPEWVYYFVRSNSFRTEAAGRMTGSVGQQRVPISFLEEKTIPIPSIEEQRRTIALLQEVEGTRRARATAEERTNQLTQAIFLEMFGDPSDLSAMKWPSCRTDSFTEVSYGLATRLDDSVTAEQGTRIITISNVKLNGSIDTGIEKYSLADAVTRKKAQLNMHDLLFNWRNGSEEHIGKTAIWEGQLPGEVLHVSFLLRLRADRTKVNPYYLWALLNILRSSGFFRRGARMNINKKFNASELSALELPVPPIDRQNTFAAAIEEVRSLQQKQTESRQQLDQLFESLLAETFSAQLDSKQQKCTAGSR